MSITIRKSLQALQPYRAGRTEENHNKALHPPIYLASNENNYGASHLVKKAIENELNKLHLYPDPNASDLISVLANDLQLSQEHFIIGNGSDNIIELIFRLLINNENDHVLTSQGTFQAIKIQTVIQQGVLDLCPLTKDDKFDLEEISNRITPRTKIIYLCNPNNPTGTLLGKDVLSSFLKSVPETAFVILDEAYHEYAQYQSDDYPNSLLHLRENVFILRTFSKAYGLAGMRIGYGIGHPEIISILKKMKTPFNTNRLAMVAAKAAFQDKRYLHFILSQNEKVLRGYQDLFDPHLWYITPSYANFIFIKERRIGLAKSLFLFLKEQNIHIRPTEAFGIDGGLRISTGTESEFLKLKSAMEKFNEIYAIKRTEFES